MGAARLYLRYLAISVRSQMEYRTSFLLLAAASFLITMVEFLAMWALFDRFGALLSFRLEHAALLYGMANLSFGAAQVVGRGFDTFPALVRSGDFDRILLRPRSTTLQVAGRDFELRKLGRALQGAAVLVWALAARGIAPGPGGALLLLLALAGGTALFLGLFVLEATMSIFTVETLEVVNIVTFGGLEASQYPMPIYSRWFRRFFTFVVPLACVNYLPAVRIAALPDPLGVPAWASWGSPLVGFAFLLLCLRVWRFGVRRYRSTGS